MKDTKNEHRMSVVGDDIYGQPLPGPEATESAGYIRQFFLHCKKASFSPTSFFETLNPRGGISSALTFAVIVSWLASAVGYFWGLVFPQLNDGIQSIILNHPLMTSSEHQPAFKILTQWNVGLGSVLLVPFLKTAEILVKSGLIYSGAAIFGSTEEKVSRRVSFESTVRVMSFGHAPVLWMSFIPLIGGWVAGTWQFVVTLIGFREVFRVSSLKAFLYLSFPAILVLFLVFVGVALMGATLFAMISALMGQF